MGVVMHYELQRCSRPTAPEQLTTPQQAMTSRSHEDSAVEIEVNITVSGSQRERDGEAEE